MITILCIVTVILAAVSALVFQCEVVPCIIVAAAAIGILVLEKVIFRKKKLIPALLCLVLFFVGLHVPQKATEYGNLDYWELSDDFVSANKKNKTEKSAEILAQIEEKYGETDWIRFAAAVSAIDKGDYEEADSLANYFGSWDSAEYCMIKEQTIPQLYESEEDVRYYLKAMYTRVADANPKWAHPSRQAGILYFLNQEYGKASYYLARAYDHTEEIDAELSYYFGAALFEEGNQAAGLILMNDAVDLGANDEIKGHIVWYLDQLE